MDIGDIGSAMKTLGHSGDDIANVLEAISDGSEAATVAIKKFGSESAVVGAKAANIFSGLGTVFMKLLPVVAAIGAVLATVAIVDALIDTPEELADRMSDSFANYESAKSEVEALNSELEETRNRIDALEAKDSLTFVEKGELAKLKEAEKLLENQKYIADQQAESARKAAVSATINAYRGTYQGNVTQDNIDRYEKLLDSGMINATSISDFNDPNNIAARVVALQRYKEAMDDLSQTDELWDNYNEKVNSLTSSIWDQAAALSDMQAKLESIPEAQRTLPEKETLAAIKNDLGYIYEKLDPNAWKQMQLDSVLSKDAFAKAKQELVEIAKASDNAGISSDYVKNNYKQLVKELEAAGITVAEFVGGINSEAGIINYDKVKSQLKDNFAGTSLERFDFATWLSGLSEEDLKLAYEISLNTDTATYTLADWQNALTEYKNNLAKSELDVDIATESDGLEKVKSAMSEAASATGLTAESVTALKNRYAELEGFDAESLFDNTATGIRLNSNYLQALEKNYEAINKLKIAEQLEEASKEYKNLSDEIKNCTDPDRRKELEARKKVLEDEIDSIEQLQAEYNGLTNAYSEWVNAMNAEQAGSQYDALVDAADDMKKAYQAGEYGNTALQEYLELMTGMEITGASSFEERIAAIDAAWTQMNARIGNTSYTLNDLLKGGQQGCNNFLKAVEGLEKGWAKFDRETGSWTLDFDNKKLAQELGTSVEFIETMLDKLRFYGFDINTGDSKESIQTLENDLFNLQKMIDDLNAKNVHIDASMEDPKEILDETKKLIDEINNSDLTDAEKTSKLNDLFGIVKNLYSMTDRPAVMDIDADNVEDGLKDGVKALQDFRDAQVEADAAKFTFGEDSNKYKEASKALEAAAQTVKNLDQDTLDKLGLSLEKTDPKELVNEIQSKMPDLKVPVKTDQAETSSLDKMKSDLASIEQKIEQIKQNTMNIKGMVDPQIESDLDSIIAKIDQIKGFSLENESALDSDEIGSGRDGEGSGACCQCGDKSSDEELETINDEEVPLSNKPIDLEIDDIDLDRNVGEDIGEKISDDIEDVELNDDAFELDSDIPDNLGESIEDDFPEVELDDDTIEIDSDAPKELASEIEDNVPEIEVPVAPSEEMESQEALEDKESTVDISVEGTDELTTAADNFDRINNKTATLTTKVSGVESVIEAKGYIDSVQSKTVVITIITRYITQGGGAGAVNGTAHASGTAYTSGSWGAKKSENALVGELGPEIVVDPRTSRWYTVGANGAQFAHIPKGAIVFNHKQSKALLENGYVTSRGTAYAGGTALAPGNTTGGGKLSGYTSAASSAGSYDGGGGGEEDKKPDKMDWIEIAVSRIEEAIDRIAIAAESAFKNLTNRTNATADQIALLNEQISLEEKAANRYLQEANSIDLPSYIKDLVRNGAIDISQYDENTQEKIDEYQDWYEKYIEESDKILELHEDIAELYQEQFEAIQDNFESQLDVLEHLTNSYENAMDRLEEQGYYETISYYKAMQDVGSDSLEVLQEELKRLNSAFDEAMSSGEIEEGSEAWYEMVISINDVKEEIDEATLSIIEYGKAIQEIEWDRFDFVRERVAKLTEESDFLLDLMEHGKLFTDNGQLTKEGTASIGLHAMNYNVYMAEADEYAKEMLRISQELAEDPYNKDLIERRDELIELQRESILSAEEEKEAIKDLVADGIDLELDALDELIEKYQDALDSAKDLFDYSNQISDHTSNISILRKQLLAYMGDDSEEGKATIQRLQDELKEAEKDLEETEYEQYISDQKKLLDDLYTEYELILNERIDNVDALLEEMIDTVNANSSAIGDTLHEVGNNVGYTLTESMKNVWNDSVTAIDGVVSKYGDDLGGKLTTINETLGAIKTYTDRMNAKLDEEARIAAEKKAAEEAARKAAEEAAKRAQASTPSGGGGYYGGDDGGSSSGGGGGTTPPKTVTSTPQSTDYSDIWNRGSSYSGVGAVAERVEKTKKYATGGLADYTGIAVLDGTPQKPELVLNPNDTANFIQLKDILRDLSNSNGSILSQSSPYAVGNNAWGRMIDISGLVSAVGNYQNNHATGVSNTFGDIVIEIDHVDDYNDFVNQLRDDKKFEEMIQSITIGRINGNSAFSKNQYRWSKH